MAPVAVPGHLPDLVDALLGLGVRREEPVPAPADPCCDRRGASGTRRARLARSRAFSASATPPLSASSSSPRSNAFSSTISYALLAILSRNGPRSLSVSLVPSCTALFLRMAFTVCLWAMWVISWPSAPASSASLWISPSAPRVMCTMPPGDANAFTPSVSRTMNVHFRFGRSDCCASSVPTSVTYLVTAGSWTTPNRSRILALTSWPILISSSSVTFRSSNFCFALVDLLRLVQEAAELGVRRSAERRRTRVPALAAS